MNMRSSTIISPYARPSLLDDLASRLPRLSPRNWAGLMIWLILLGLGAGALNQPSHLSQAGPIAHAADNNLPDAPQRAVTLGVTLPGGPTGQQFPPGTMAPAKSYGNGYTRGQCTWYVASRRHIPGNWGNARSWLANARRAGYKTGSTPAVGAIAWSGSGWYGHVALVESINGATGQVYVAEMNYTRPYAITHRWVAPGSFRYIY